MSVAASREEFAATAQTADRALSSAKVKSGRDESLDLIRGFAAVGMVVAHLERTSFLSLLVWERVGMVSSAECFVLVSGVTVGMLARKRWAEVGDATRGMWKRAMQLYRVALALAVLVFLVSIIPRVNATAVTTFVDRASGQSFPLYPRWGDSLPKVVGDLLWLRAGSHQVQILGLYVWCLLVGPVAVTLFAQKHTLLALGVSWFLYLVQRVSPSMPSGMAFEYAFPLLLWQLLFIHGLAAGFHRARLEAWLRTRAGRALVVVAVLFALGGFFLAQCTTNPLVPGWARLHLVSSATFGALRDRWFGKNDLGLGRVLNDGALLLCVWMALRAVPKLAHAWPFRWIAEMGRATLYVFVLQLFVVWGVSLVAPFALVREPPLRLLFLNTAIHLAAIAGIFVAIRRKFLFGIIPR